MAVITFDANNLNPTNFPNCELYTHVPAEAMAAGKCGYLLATGKVGVAALTVSGKKNPIGVNLRGVSPGQAAGIMRRGYISGFNVSGLSCGALVYVNDAGDLDTAAGTVSIVVGRVEATSDGEFSKIIYLDFPKPALVA
ncbi:hypothetical protein EP7_005649 (plasmid) [Isosphaeraceae bacterium EP7]